MKTILTAATLVCVAVLAAFFAGRYSTPKTALSSTNPAASEAAAPALTPAPAPLPDLPPSPEPASKPPRTETAPSPNAPVAPAAAPALNPLVNQALSTLVSPQATHDQKQYAWEQLRTAGKLDTAIGELEQRTAANPNLADYPAALGQAYLHKAGSIQDLREQGILGMKADQSFESALALDPTNWEARYWKTAAMSYWPVELGKGPEVIQNCLDLIKQQESQAPQPQYAQTYLLLGDTYIKQGQADFARQVWQRGAGLFPNYGPLQDRLSGRPQTAQAPNPSSR